MSKDYFARLALSNSGIKRLLQSPAHFRYYTDTPQVPSTAMRQGSAFHALILEPHLVDSQLAIFDVTKTLHSKAGAAFMADNADKICLTKDEYDEVKTWTEPLLAKQKICRLLASCEVEKKVYTDCETSFGIIPCKAMFDACNDQIIIDLKTTDKSAKDFAYEAKKYDYRIQASWYQYMAEKLDGKTRDFYFIVVEKNPPHGILIYKASEDFLADGWEKCSYAMEKYGECIAMNNWPSYDSENILTL